MLRDRRTLVYAPCNICHIDITSHTRTTCRMYWITIRIRQGCSMYLLQSEIYSPKQ